MINPNIWDDPNFIKLSRDARLLFIGLFSNADDFGRLRGNAGYLRKTVFGYDDVKIEEVSMWREEVLNTMKHVVLYEVEEEEYLYLENWSKHQTLRQDRIQKSELPPPPASQNQEEIEEIQPDDNQMTTNPQPDDNHPRAEVKRSKEKLREEKLSKDRVSGADAPTPQSEAFNFFKNSDEWEKVIKALKNRGINEDIARSEIHKFVNYWTEKDKTGQKTRWQLQKTFEISRRLNTWFLNIPKFGGSPRAGPQESIRQV